MHLSHGRANPRAEQAGFLSEESHVLWKKSAMAQPLCLAGAVVPSVLIEDPTTGLLHRHRACFLSKVRISSSFLRINSQRSLQLYFFLGLLLSLGTFVLSAGRSCHPSTWKHD